MLEFVLTTPQPHHHPTIPPPLPHHHLPTCPQDISKTEALAFPALYEEGPAGIYFSAAVFWRW